MKRIFEIECPEDIAEVWLDEDTVNGMFMDHPHIIDVVVKDITEDHFKLKRVVDAFLITERIKLPKDTTSEDYQQKAEFRNQALLELTEALVEVGYRGEE